MQIRNVCRVAVLTGAVVSGLLVSLPAQEKSAASSSTETEKQSSKSSRAEIQEALSSFNSLIGGWRGVGQVRRGSTRGAWRETGTFVWKFSGGKVGIEYRVKDAEHIQTGLVSWDVAKKQFTMEAVLADESKRTYRGELKNKVLTLISEPDKEGMVSRVTMRQLNDKRMLVLYERRREGQSFYARVGEVGYTREGTRLASSDNSGPECVVTGGAGTIKVSHEGKTYYVCCTGCRDAFNDDPVGILADYRAKLAKEQSKSQ